MLYKIYVVRLKRKNPISGLPEMVYKLGITSSSDALSRINYSGEDEPHPITEIFEAPSKPVTTPRKYSKDEALRIEKMIQDRIKGKDASHFHNWYEPVQISGITEMRVWDNNEFQAIRKMILEEFN